MPTHILVTAPEGRKTPIGANDASDPTGGLLLVEPGRVTRVRYSQDVRRSVARGDLLPCNLHGTTVALEQAAADAPLDTDPHVTEIDRELARKRPAAMTATTDASRLASFDTSDEGKR